MSADAPQVRIRERTELTADELRALLAWLEAAYDEGPWRPEHWDDLGPGPHLTIEDADGALLAHACVDWITVETGGTRLRAAYLEDVATRADVRGRGLGTALIDAADALIRSGSELGLLATGSLGFYARRGWVPWRGPLAVREPDGDLTPTPEEQGSVMALLHDRTPRGIDLDALLVRPRRDPDEAW
jgi:aminoglycoside 2'-N-acetyltransferase I